MSLCCAGGCGTLAHLSCLPDSSQAKQSFLCPACTAKPIGGANAAVLRRISDLTNIILSQSYEIFSLKKEFMEQKSELIETKKEVLALRSAIKSTKPFVFGAQNTGSAFSASSGSSAGGGGPMTLAVPSINIDSAGRSRSNSVKRKRTGTENKDRPVVIGSAEGPSVVTVVKKIVKKKVFISRVAPDFSAEAMFHAVKPRLKSSLSVVRLHTVHSSYSSFCLFVDEVDEETVLAAQFWASGTVIKPFFGRVFDERIHSRFDEPIAKSPLPNPVAPVPLVDPNDPTKDSSMEDV